MIATKLVISQETRARLNNPVLSPAKKRLLREEMIKESIRKAPGGIRTKQELIVAAGYNPKSRTKDYANGLNLISSMVKRGVIYHATTDSFKKRWFVANEVKVTPSPRSIAKELFGPKEVKVEPKEKLPVSAVELVQLAKDFAWRENSDSLRDFIAYMQNVVK